HARVPHIETIVGGEFARPIDQLLPLLSVREPVAREPLNERLVRRGESAPHPGFPLVWYRGRIDRVRDRIAGRDRFSDTPSLWRRGMAGNIIAHLRRVVHCISESMRSVSWQRGWVFSWGVFRRSRSIAGSP